MAAQAVDIDWEKAKSLYISGVRPLAIAEQMGVKVQTLYKRIDRGGWADLRTRTQQTLSRTGPGDMKARAQTWQENIADLMETRLNHLKSIPPDKLKLSDLETLARITELTDKQARRTFGLDQNQGQVSIGLVNVTLVTEAYKQPDSPAIDIQAESSDTP